MIVAWSRRGWPELSHQAFVRLLHDVQLRYFVHEVGPLEPESPALAPIPQIPDVDLAAVNVTCALRESSELEALRRYLAAAAEAGASAVNLHVLHSLGEFDPLPATLVERLVTLGDEAQAHGLDLCLDSMCGLGGTRHGIERTLKQLDHPAIRLQLDCGGFVLQNPGSQFEVAIQRLIGWAGSLRLSDMVEFSAVADFPPLGSGASVDFARVWQLISTMKLRIPCEVYFRPVDARPASEQQIGQYLRESLQTLRYCGWRWDQASSE